MSGAGSLQRKVQRFPRLQGGSAALQPSSLALGLGQDPQLLPHRVTGCLSLFRSAGIQEFRFRDGMAFDEHAVLQFGVLFDGIQRCVDVGELSLTLGERRAAPLKQRRPLGVRKDLPGFADLHTAQVQQSFQKFFPAICHCNNMELFHFDNGHLSVSLPFLQ